MKNLNLLLFALMALLAFSSCDSDDDDDDSIVGKWKLTSITADIECNNSYVKDYIESYHYDDDSNYNSAIEFFGNGTWKGSDGDTGKYKLKDGKIAQAYDDDEPEDSDYISYVIDGNRLIFKYDETEYFQSALPRIIEILISDKVATESQLAGAKITKVIENEIFERQ